MTVYVLVYIYTANIYIEKHICTHDCIYIANTYWYICVRWLIQMWNSGWFIRNILRLNTCIAKLWHNTYTRTYMFVWRAGFICDMACSILKSNELARKSNTYIQDRSNYRSLLQKSPTKETIFCKRDHMHSSNGVATISRLLKIIGLFCKRAL